MFKLIKNDEITITTLHFFTANDNSSIETKNQRQIHKEKYKSKSMNNWIDWFFKPLNCAPLRPGIARKMTKTCAGKYARPGYRPWWPELPTGISASLHQACDDCWSGEWRSRPARPALPAEPHRPALPTNRHLLRATFYQRQKAVPNSISSVNKKRKRKNKQTKINR